MFGRTLLVHRFDRRRREKGRRRGSIEPVAVQANRAALRRIGFGIVVSVVADVERNEQLRKDEKHRKYDIACRLQTPLLWPLVGICLHLEV